MGFSFRNRITLASGKISGRYGIVSVDLTCSFCCDFEFSFASG